ncbi:hypothetical protein [Paenibacillus taichungensis]|uniref:hypothetical protein n=1 Tax=Paenibacillus taichungensis TaxID=484184 RepID=UPI0038CF4C3D
MGAAWINRGVLVRQTAEVIGYKAGLALTKKEFDTIIPKHYYEIWEGPDAELLRIRSEEYDDLIAHLLYEVGNIESPDSLPHVTLTKT